MAQQSLQKGQCRLCLKSVDYKLLIDVFLNDRNLLNNIFESTGVEISQNDPWSSKICRHCHLIVKLFTEFKIACIQANLILVDHQVQLDKPDWLDERHNTTLTNIEYYVNKQRKDIDDLYSTKVCPIEPESIKKEFNTDYSSFEEVIVAVGLEDFKQEAERLENEENDDDDLEPDNIQDPRVKEILIRAKINAVNKKANCELCSKEFRIAALEGHLNAHYDIRPYLCDIQECNESFHSVRKRRDHRRTEHKGVEKPKRTRSSDKPNRTICICHLCGKKTTRSLIEDHMNLHLNVRPYKCDYCAKDFHALVRLKYHLRLMHGNDGEGVKRKRSYVSPKAPCPMCGKEIAIANMKYHINLHNDYRPYVCDFEGCGAAFGSPKNMRNHRRHEHSTTKFICAVCGKEFKAERNLQVHMTFHKEPTIPCDICGKLEKSKALLKQHMLTHSSERPHKCQVCGKNFQIKKTLNIHMRTHLNIRPFKCDLCDQDFTYNCSLKNHKEKYHQKIM